MNWLIAQVFLGVLLLGLLTIVIFFIFKSIFAPKKISTLKNYLKTENYKAAINLAKDILSKDKDNLEAHYYLANAYYKQGKYELALIEYKRAEKKGFYDKIDEKELRERLGELYQKIDNNEEALKEYILLTKKYPSNNLYYFKAGELFEKLGKEQQAIKFYHNSVKLNKSFVPAILNLGILLFKSKNYTEAKKFLNASVLKDPNSNEGYFYLGLLEKNENNFKGALKFFEKSARDKEYKVRSLMERGVILMAQRKYDDAALELNRALKNCDMEGNIKINIRYVLASCYEFKRNITEAISLWEEIYAINPSFKDVTEKLTDYQDLRVDDRMKDFLTATDTDFLDICKGIILNMGLNIIEFDILTNDSIEFFCLAPDSKWRNMKKRPTIIHISRRNSPVDEKVIRDLNEKMRNKNVIKAYVITSSSFSKLAVAYAKERPIELIEKSGLQNLLNDSKT